MTSFSSTATPFMGVFPSRLLTQYRMHPAISNWPNKSLSLSLYSLSVCLSFPPVLPCLERIDLSLSLPFSFLSIYFSLPLVLDSIHNTPHTQTHTHTNTHKHTQTHTNKYTHTRAARFTKASYWTVSLPTAACPLPGSRGPRTAPCAWC